MNRRLRTLFSGSILLSALAACTQQAATDSKASFDSDLFAKPPAVLYKDGHYFVAIFPKENWSVAVADVTMDIADGRTIIYATKLKHGPATSPQLFALDVPPGIEPQVFGERLYWKEPDGWIQPLKIITQRPSETRP